MIKTVRDINPPALQRPEIDLVQLRAFAVVSEELHFGRAALRLGIAQPPLSQQIRRLEDRVGCRLFLRGTRKVELTEPGAALLVTARRVLGETAAGLEQARRIGRGEAGSLEIGFPASVALDLLPLILREFRASYPEITLQLSEHTTAVQIEQLRAGALDIGFAREPAPDPDIESEPVRREGFVAVLPDGHDLARGKGAVSAAALAADNFVMYRRDVGPLSYDRILGLCRDAGFEPRIVQESSEWQTLVSLVGAGLGVAVAPACVARLTLAGIVYREIATAAVTEISLCWRRDNRRAVLDRFIETALRATRP